MLNVAAVRLGALAALALLAAGCGSSAKGGSRPTTSVSNVESGGRARVVMQSLAFTPTTVLAKVGSSVAWVNEDTSPHNVTYVSGPRFTASGLLKHGARFAIKLTQPGTIHYFCSIHPWMRATISVSP